MLKRIELAATPTNQQVNCNNNDVERHLISLRHNFVGLPLVCFELVRHIVHLRRKIDRRTHWNAFQKLIEKYEAVILAEMNTRWLISICDTYADYGSPVERASALVAVVCLNTLKLAETERRFIQSTGAKVHPKYLSGGIPLFDGVASYSVELGDMPANMFKRIDRVLGECPFLKRLWLTILERLKHSDNVFSRLARWHRDGMFFRKDSGSAGSG